jgi:predicted dehydrogenase
MLRDELIGRPLSFRTILANSGVEYTVAQQALGDFYDRNLKNTGGVMLNVGCHRVDLMRFIFDSDFSRVLAFTPTTDKRFADGGLIDREDTAMISAEMKNGVNGSFWITWCNYGPARAEAEFFGSAGFIRAGAEGVDLWRGQECTHYSIPAEERDPHGFKIVENFLDVLVNGAVPVDSAVDGLECMRVLKAVEESNRKGGWAFL